MNTFAENAAAQEAESPQYQPSRGLGSLRVHFALMVVVGCGAMAILLYAPLMAGAKWRADRANSEAVQRALLNENAEQPITAETQR